MSTITTIELATPFVYDFSFGESITYNAVATSQYADGNLALLMVSEDAYEREVISVNLIDFLPEHLFYANANSEFAMAAIKHLTDLGLVIASKLPAKQSGFVTYPVYEWLLADDE